jgi:hypothetical protein
VPLFSAIEPEELFCNRASTIRNMMANRNYRTVKCLPMLQRRHISAGRAMIRDRYLCRSGNHVAIFYQKPGITIWSQVMNVYISPKTVNMRQTNSDHPRDWTPRSLNHVKKYRNVRVISNAVLLLWSHLVDHNALIRFVWMTFCYEWNYAVMITWLLVKKIVCFTGLRNK